MHDGYGGWERGDVPDDGTRFSCAQGWRCSRLARFSCAQGWLALDLRLMAANDAGQAAAMAYLHGVGTAVSAEVERLAAPISDFHDRLALTAVVVVLLLYVVGWWLWWRWW